MRVLGSNKFLVALAALIVAGATSAIAIPAVISQRILNDNGGVHFRIVRTVADGYDSGWHVHPGVAIVQVQEGSFQIYQGSCTPRTVGAGETYIEVPHLAVRGIATGRVAWTTTLITTPDDPPQIAWSAYSPQNPDPCPGVG
jgi:quercetin dioxygenase-like cupin family protein